MARRFQTTDVVTVASDSRFNVSGWNTWSLWLRDHATSVDDVNLMSRAASHAAAGGVQIIGGLSGTNRIIYSLLDFSGSYGGALETSTALSANQWHHVAMRFYNAGTGQTNDLWLNGSQEDTLASGSFTFSSSDVVAGYLSGTTSTGKDVDIAEVSWWGARLSDNELRALARGMLPHRVAADNLLLYLPLWGLHSPEIDLSAYSDTGTVTGTTTVNGPPVRPFTRTQSMATLTASYLTMSKYRFRYDDGDLGVPP